MSGQPGGMVIVQGHGTVDPLSPQPSPSPVGLSAVGPKWAWVPAVVIAGLVVVEALRQGGFWPADAATVALVSLVVVVILLVVSRLRWAEWVLVGSLTLLALWWLDRANAAGSISRFLPLGASILGFLAAFLCTRGLSRPHKEVAACFVALLGAGVAAIGFVGLVWRWDPLAMPSQYLWRLSSSLTYADAAGVVLALGLIMALATGRWPRTARVSVCLCTAGLLATQSRGPMLAFACACALIPLDQYRRNLLPLAEGFAVGVLAIATSGSDRPVPLLGVAVVAAMAMSAAKLPRRAPSPLSRRRLAIASAVGCVAVLGCLGVLHRQVELRVLAPSNGDRSVEWSTAIDQFRAEPIVGVGSDQPLEFRAADGTSANFVHNEYLQITADAGLVGLVLLVSAGVALGGIVRRRDVMTSCAVAGLVCWGVAAGFDFDWHLPVVGLMGGWLAGLGAVAGTWPSRDDGAGSSEMAQQLATSNTNGVDT